VSWDVSWSKVASGFDFSGVLRLTEKAVVLSSKMLGFLNRKTIRLADLMSCDVEGNAGCISTRGKKQTKRSFKCISGFTEVKRCLVLFCCVVYSFCSD
jgi:hypothetical protein